jgi:hypothetical protein
MVNESRSDNPDSVLTLDSYLLFSTHESPRTGLADSAVYFIGASAVRIESGEMVSPVQDYKLLVLAESVESDRIWQENEDFVVHPFVVPSRAARDGILRYMQVTYFDADDPTRINELAPYLVGPITDDTL